MKRLVPVALVLLVIGLILRLPTRPGPQIYAPTNQTPLQTVSVPPPSIETASKPEERVNAYIMDWHRNWAFSMAQMGDSWNSPEDHIPREQAVQKQHFVEGAVEDPSMGGSFGDPPDHDPKSDKILPAVINGNAATVETQNSELNNYYEFSLTNIDNDWRIHKVTHFFDPPGATVFSDARRSELLAHPSPSAPLPELPMGVEPNCHRLFENGRRITIQGNRMTIEVRDVGQISIPSGVIGAADFGYSGHDFQPLSRSVDGGTYRAQQATADGTVIAARIIFREDSDVKEYRPAPPAEGSDPYLHYVGVDYANVAVFDAASYVQLGARELERLYIDSCNWGARKLTADEIRREMERFKSSRLVGLTLEELQRDLENRTVYSDLPPPLRIRVGPNDTPNGFKFRSGYGDGSYPAYWGLDESGAAVNLTIDFLVAAEFLTEKVKVDWSSAQLGQGIDHPVLEKWGQNVELDHEDGDGFIKVTGIDRVERARLLGRGGQVLADSDGGGSSHSGDENSYYFDKDIRRINSATLEIVVSTGYRN